MAKKQVEITFKTITPLWTGDAWGDNKEIKPSSLIGSLRFWFAFYRKIIYPSNIEKLNKDGVPEESIQELQNIKQKNFEELLFSKIQESNNFEEAIDKALDELGLSVPSRIFGCTGWKSRLKINDITYNRKKTLNISNIEFNFPNNTNTKFWIKKVLFKENQSISFFEDCKVKISIEDYWWEKYLKDFFEFFKDKLILVGGKNSFGFGFVNLQVSQENVNLLNNNSSIKNFLVISKLEKIPYDNKNKKEILGFNFKYFLRKKENKKYRTLNFGQQGQASKIYVSNWLKYDNNSIYLLLINNPFDNNQLPEKVFEKYKNLLNNLINGDYDGAS